MRQFRGSATNKIDAKGRISVPARFRAVIEADGLASVFCYCSLTHPVLDAGGRRLMDEVDQILARLAPYSDQREELSHALIGGSEELSLDREGRIALPEHFRHFAKLGEAATFVGLGARFQLWKPEAWDRQFAAARAAAREHRQLLRAPAGPEEAAK